MGNGFLILRFENNASYLLGELGLSLNTQHLRGLVSPQHYITIGWCDFSANHSLTALTQKHQLPAVAVQIHVLKKTCRSKSCSSEQWLQKKWLFSLVTKAVLQEEEAKSFQTAFFCKISNVESQIICSIIFVCIFRGVAASDGTHLDHCCKTTTASLHLNETQTPRRQQPLKGFLYEGI